MKVLILSATTGGGHMSAANALKDLINKKDPASQVTVLDCIEYVSHPLNRLIAGGYKQLATKTPNLFGVLYRTTNKQNPVNSAASSIIKKFSERLYGLVCDLNPDVVVCTHAFPGDMITKLKIKHNLKLPVITVLTDYAPHRMYVNKGTDAYVVSNDEMIAPLVKMGVDENSIKSIGIPINMAFYSQVDKEKELREMGLDPKKKTLLIMAGSFGVTDILKIYGEITEVEDDFQIIVITGKNQKLYNAFEIILSREDGNKKHDFKQIAKELPTLNTLALKPVKIKPTKLLYFTKEVQKYMHCADLIITKPGGLTVSESLASSLPLAIFKAFPGQEEENCDFLIKNGAAVKIDKHNCREVISALIKNEEQLTNMKNSCIRICKVRAAENLYNYMLEITSQNKI